MSQAKTYRRNPWKRLTLKWKVPLLIALPTVAITLAVSYISFNQTVSYMEEQREKSAHALLRDKADALKLWSDTVETGIRTLVDTSMTRESMTEFSRAWTVMGGDVAGQLRRAYIEENPYPLGKRETLDVAKDGSVWSETHERRHSVLRGVVHVSGYYDVFLINTRGDIVYTVTKEADFATNLRDGPYNDSGLADVFRAALSGEPGKVHWSTFGPYAPSNGAPAKFAAAPIIGANGEVLGVLALQVDMTVPANVMEIEPGPGIPLTYAMDLDRHLLTPPPGAGYEVFDQLPSRAFDAAILRDGRVAQHGVPGITTEVIEAYGIIEEIAGTDWQLIAELDESYAHIVEGEVAMSTLLQTAVVTALILLSGWLVAFALTRRIDALGRTVETVAKGDYDAPNPQAKTGDELGDIARALEGFKRGLASAKAAEVEREARARQLEKVMSTLRESLSRLADGDLNCQIHHPMGAEYEALRNYFNETVQSLAVIIGELRASAEAIDTDARDMSDGADALSKRTENQAATLEETAAAMDEITSSVASTAEGANKIVAAINVARTEAQRGEEVRNRAVNRPGFAGG